MGRGSAAQFAVGPGLISLVQRTDTNPYSRSKKSKLHDNSKAKKRMIYLLHNFN